MNIEKEKDIINELITCHDECEYLDFKQIPYKKEKLVDFVKDVVAFANSECRQDKYIILGIEDISKNIIGIDIEDMQDSAILQNLLIQKVEPDINIESSTIQYDGQVIGYIKILASNNNRPYLIKDDYEKGNKKIKTGELFIRKGSFNSHMTRADLDKIYSSGSFEVSFYENVLFISPISIEKKNKLDFDPTYGLISATFKNFSQRPVTIDSGWIEICDMNNNILTNHQIVHIGDINQSDLCYTFSPNVEKVLKLFVSFSSNDCITLNLDDDGAADDIFSLRLTLKDINDNEYTTILDECFLIVRGPVLHKIQLKYKMMRKYLKTNFSQLIKSIKIKDYPMIEKIMSSKEIDFALVKADHILNTEAFPETHYLYECVKLAVEIKDDNLLAYFKKIGMDENIILKAQGVKVDNELPKKEFELWDVVNERNRNAFLESRKFEINEEIKS